MLQLRMMTHMHHIQNIKHVMYPKYPNEKYFNKVQVQYLSKCTEPPSVCGPVHVLVTGQCNSYCRTGEDQRGQHLPNFPLHPHASCSWKTLERNFLDLLLLFLLHFLEHDAANSRYKCRCLNGPQLDFMNPRQKHLKTQRSGSSFH